MKNYTSLHVKIINQLFELEKKTNLNPELSSLQRNLQRIKQYFEDEGYSILDPIGERYHETRTDYEATISGDGASDSMQITSVIKPIIYQQENNAKTILQKGVVIVSGQ